MADQNKKTIRMSREQAPTNPSVLDGLYTDDYVYHGIPLLGDLKGPAAFKAMFTGFTGAISDFREEVVDQIAEGDQREKDTSSASASAFAASPALVFAP